MEKGTRGFFGVRFFRVGFGNDVPTFETEIPGSLPGFFVFKDVTDLCFQHREIINTIVPEDRWFDTKICMSQDITEPGNLFPVGFFGIAP